MRGEHRPAIQTVRLTRRTFAHPFRPSSIKPACGVPNRKGESNRNGRITQKPQLNADG
jgi:hypothetical protein